ncbi:phytoene desaturase [Corynebacterium sp. sy017]|uniref:phytoene desaturase family protein n=1 Tax=unclassified Corynebacterium TaxID=2624378 RepID=UPI001185A38A|nr:MULTISPECIES: phytoene desaturase family protein [unclassified Corynebacterium]MBP3088548.1 phytoene desaturase [Corynebacterium sp. sy017]TSD91848.1 phytoene desaturase [Corynebacterium sp. SY003]
MTNARQEHQKHQARAVVIGAGYAGLASAILLAQDGYAVRVVEKLAQPGGRAESISEQGFRWDTGPSWYLMPEAYEHFFRLCGTDIANECELVELSPAYRVFSGAERSCDVHAGVDNIAELFENIEPGAGAKIRAYLAQATQVYQLALETFLYTTFSSIAPLLRLKILSRVHWLVAGISRSIEHKTNRIVAHPLLRQILQYPAVFLSSQPAQTPALYALMSHTDLVEGPRYPQGGFAAISAALWRIAQENGVEFSFNTEVTAIETAHKQVRGVRSIRGELFDADLVVHAGDIRHCELELLQPEQRSYPERYWQRAHPGVSAVIIMLGVRGELPQLVHHNLLFSPDWEPDFHAIYTGAHPERPDRISESLYVCKPSHTDPTVAPAGHENLFILVPAPAEECYGHGSAFGEQESEWVSHVVRNTIARLAHWANIPDLAQRIVVQKTIGPADYAQRYHSWSAGAIGRAHTLRQSAFLRGKNVSAKVDGLYYAGASTVPGVGVPLCLISAENVLKRIHGDSSSRPFSY